MTRPAVDAPVAVPLAAAAGALLAAAGVLLVLAALLQAASSATAPTDTPSAAPSRTVPECRARTDAVIVIVSCGLRYGHSDYESDDERA
jgi:type IV secretory pathway VirB2 component (pilin)